MSSYTYHPKFGLCFDTETSGSSWGPFAQSAKEYQCLSIGLIIFDFETLDIVDKIYLEFKYNPKYKWSPEAEAIHGLSKDYLNENGLDLSDGIEVIANFLLPYFGLEGEIICMGINVNFDIEFLGQLLSDNGINFNISHRQIDLVGVGGVCFNKIKSDHIFEYLDLPARKTHNALEDALFTLEAAKRTRLIFQSALN
jgi:DNA polymerase III epsilon subunit-like protein